jgi:hypothetical protein
MEAVMGSKKRKHEFEDRVVVEGIFEGEDKENSREIGEDFGEEMERPAKRMKSSAVSPTKASEARASSNGMSAVKGGMGKGEAKAPAEKKRTTLGVKPKGAKTAPPPVSTAKKSAGNTTISQARLNALSQPKKR